MYTCISCFIYNVGVICVLMRLGVVCPWHADEIKHMHYTIHIVSIIHTRGNSYITSIDMRCGKVANLNYAVFLSFHKLTLENSMYYLYLYSIGKLPLEPVRYMLVFLFT